MDTNAICCLCGEIGVPDNPLTKEHVPPKQFFAKSIRIEQELNLWTVPSHAACNQGYKKDEEYFYHAMLPVVDKQNPHFSSIYRSDLKRRASHHQTQNLIKKLKKSFHPHSTGGIQLPPGVVEFELDEQRINRVILKIAQCIIFREKSRYIPQEMCLDMRMFVSEQEVPEFYKSSWELSSSRNYLESQLEDSKIIIMTEDFGERYPKGVYPSVFSYHYAEFDDFQILNLCFWQSVIFGLTFKEMQT